MKTKRFRLGELFSGPGGLGYAAVNSLSDDGKYSVSHEWASDFDRDSCDTYARNICPENPESVICKDVRKLDINSLNPIDAFAFGFPCNDFSMVGEQKGLDGSYGPLYTYGVKVLKKFQPLWFLAENVGGLRNSNEGKAFDMILKALFDSGYDVFPHYYKFERYGVPQNRHRVIIIGIRKDLHLRFGIPSSKKYSDWDISAKKALTVPTIPSDAPNNELTKQSQAVIERLKYIRPGENAFNADLPEHLRLNVKGAKISQIYRRLDPGKPSYTVTGSGGGGTHVYHWSENRALTNRERARLQTFPDHFVFCGSKEKVRKQIGMAVPVQGAKVIFKAVLNTFAGISYETEEPSIEPLVH
ncbi:MAG TPA: DNA cytosine methyltransferase [Leptospiraceae bacterium]|nr:DNA cytosine methyltransferase [Leptospiraceae bacterium]